MKDYDRYDATGAREAGARASRCLRRVARRGDRAHGSRQCRASTRWWLVTTTKRARRSAPACLTGPFHGVPFLLKDLHALLAGTVTSNGCRFFADNRADHDTELVARYKRGGLNIFGKTNTPEFGLTVTTEPKLLGPTRNPWNLDYMAGGSSGGAAAAVAAGIVPAAHASDGGGSIRIPASCCGLFGLKPTRARNPHGPDRGEGWSGMSTEHVVARSVRDSAALLDVTCGPDVGAPYFAPPPQRPFAQEVGAAPGTPADRAGHAHRSRRRQSTRNASGRCVMPPRCWMASDTTSRKPRWLPSKTGFGPAFRVIIAGNQRATIETYAQKIGRSPAPDELEKVTWLFFEAGAQEQRRRLRPCRRRACTAPGGRSPSCSRRFDLILTPTLPKPPQRIGTFSMMTDDPEAYGREVGYFTSFTAIVNVAGNPAVTLPLHWTPDGLPVGVQLIGRYADEATLLRVSAQVEQARPWFDRRPAI